MLSFFPLDVLDKIWDVIESVSEGFLTYFYHVSMYFYVSSTGPSGVGHFKPAYYHLNKLSKGLLGHATNRISST